MKLFRISQTVNTDYDTYSKAIVVAKDEEDARRIHPSQEDFLFKDIFYDGVFKIKRNDGDDDVFEDKYGSWTNDISKVEVEYIGEAKKGLKRGVVCASFHAG